MKLPFSKYSGSGNDFILIDNRHHQFPVSQKDAIVHLCQRKTGIGADGIILLENSSHADFKMRIFNADGSEAEMCGNGARCLFKFILSLGFKQNTYKIETMHSTVTLAFKNNDVVVSMPKPKDFRLDHKLAIGEHTLQVHHVNTGVPHCVLFVENLESEHWMEIAPLIRHHSIFAPHGVNVNFSHLDPLGHIYLRTYERGVEGETLACGTGAVAAALIAAELFALPSPIQVHPISNEILEVSFNDQPDHVCLAGPAKFVFQGEIFNSD